MKGSVIQEILSFRRWGGRTLRQIVSFRIDSVFPPGVRAPFLNMQVPRPRTGPPRVGRSARRGPWTSLITEVAKQELSTFENTKITKVWIGLELNMRSTLNNSFQKQSSRVYQGTPDSFSYFPLVRTNLRYLSEMYLITLFP